LFHPSWADSKARHVNELTALDYLALAIRTYHHSGDVAIMRVPLAVLAAFIHRLGPDEPAAAIADYAVSPITTAWIPELSSAIAHLREVLGEQTYESFARKGATVTTAEMATYAYDQIDQAPTELNAVSKQTRYEVHPICPCGSPR
jgi:hypothetical protein